jgi:hypothetical protein
VPTTSGRRLNLPFVHCDVPQRTSENTPSKTLGE